MADRRASILALGKFPAGTDAFVVAGITRAVSRRRHGIGNSTCLSGYSGSGPLPNAHVYVFSGTVTPSSGLTPVVEPEITLSSSGSYSYSQPFLLAGGYTLAVACTRTSNAETSTVAFLPTASMTATVTANQTAAVNF